MQKKVQTSWGSVARWYDEAVEKEGVVSARLSRRKNCVIVDTLNE